MPNLSANLCQRVPTPLSLLLVLLACDASPGAHGLELGGAGAAAAAPRGELPPLAAPSPSPPPPPSCPAIGCEPQRFQVRFERAVPWSAGTYFIRASVDGGPAHVCSVVFAPVLGAAHDTCDEQGLPFAVHYRYDEQEQTLLGVSFGQVHAVRLSVLTSEQEPPLVELEHQLTFQYASSSGGCGACPASPAPLSVRVRESAELAHAGQGDAGLRPDGGAPAFDSDAGDAGSEPLPSGS